MHVILLKNIKEKSRKKSELDIFVAPTHNSQNFSPPQMNSLAHNYKQNETSQMQYGNS